MEESEPPTFPHTTATSLTPHPQSVSGLISYKNLICQNISPEGRECGKALQKQQVRAGAGLGIGNRAGLVQDPLPCARRFPQAGTAGTIPSVLLVVPGEEEGPQSCHPEHEGQGRTQPPGSAFPAKRTPRESSALPTHPEGSQQSTRTVTPSCSTQQSFQALTPSQLQTQDLLI